MRLSTKDRMLLLSILPREGDFKTLKTLRLFREDLSFTDEENESLNFKSKDGTITWDQPDKSKPYVKKISISRSVESLIVETLEKMNENKKLTDDHFELYERFCVNELEAAE